MDLFHHGTRKFPRADLILSSATRGWTGVAAEVRAHPAGDLPPITSKQFEITLSLRDVPNGLVRRKGDGTQQVTAVKRGTVWLCPINVAEDQTSITADLPEILHVYLPEERFRSVGVDYGLSELSGRSIAYLADVDDNLIRQLGASLLGELREETSSGRMLAESIGLTAISRLCHAYSQSSVRRNAELSSLDCPQRIARVTDYIRDNLENDLTIDELARVACLSPFHFARMFKRTTGRTPHGYVSSERLALAKRLLIQRSRTLAEVAYRSGFSTQASFNRSFRKVEGCTPTEYIRRQSS